MVIYIILFLGMLLSIAIFNKYRANRLMAEINDRNVAMQKAIQNALDELGDFALKKSITADELKNESEKTFAVLQSFNANGDLNPLIADTEQWLKDELKKLELVTPI
ncbi:MAG: hypothetical protein V4732_22045 [Pseudomonadota bacterium]